jgi:hypothetical protein
VWLCTLPTATKTFYEIDGPWIIRAERTEEGDHLRRFRFDELQVDRNEHPMFVFGGSRLHEVCRR